MAAPDRGTWNFSWDGLSRLRTQTDARQVLKGGAPGADARGGCGDLAHVSRAG